MALTGLRGGGIAIDVQADLRDVRRMLSDMENRAVDTAAQQALNRVITSVRGEAVNQLYRDTGIQKKLIREKLRLKKATRGDLQAVLDAEPAKAVNLIQYVAPANRKPNHFNKKLKSGKYRYEGVRARAWGKPKTYKGTFIGTGRGGQPLVFARTGAGRQPIKAISGPSPRRSFVREAIQRVMTEHARARWVVEFQRALDNQLRRLRAK